jgi:hypothetical protein
MGIMGWSTTAMAARYQHITDAVRRDIADRIGGLLWAAPVDGVSAGAAVNGEPGE